MKHYKHQVFSYGTGPTTEQIDFFQSNGFIHFKHFIPKESVSDLIDEVNKVQSHLINNNIREINGIPLKYGKDTNEKTLIQRIAFASQFSDHLQQFLKDARLQQVTCLLGGIEGRIGENEKDGLVINHYINTEDSAFRQMGWHTDGLRDIFLGTRIKPMLNVGLHLDDCPRSNGGLRLLAGTHRQGLFQLLFRKKYFIDTKPDKNEIGFDIEAGDLTVHDGRLWHRVEPSPFVGARSRRRVIYVPVVTGAYQPKHAGSATPFYHKLAQIKLKNYLPGHAPKNAQGLGDIKHVYTD
jgi:phytanoyl-CoA hydroxylase